MPAPKKDPWLDWCPPAESIKQAIALIAPTPEQRDQCTEAVIRALWQLHIAEKMEAAILSPAESRDRFRNFAKALRVIEETGRNLVPDIFLEEVVRHRETYEMLTAKIPVRADSAKRRYAVNEIAVSLARRLLTDFSATPPRVTRKGSWHKLTSILTCKPADERSFAYVARHHRESKAPR